MIVNGRGDDGTRREELGALDAVQDVATEPMARFDKRMIEIVGGIARHTEALHHTLRANVRDGRHRYHLLAREFLEGKGERSACAFRRVSMMPGIEGKTPADFQGGREMSFEGNFLERDHARERRPAFDFRDPPAIAVALERGAQSRGRRLGPFAIGNGRKELHDAGVDAHRRPRVQIAVPPRAQG